MNKIEKTFRGTVMTLEDGSQIERSFHFEPSDIGRFIVIRWRYQQNMFWGSLFGTQLAVNGYHLNERKDELYGVYKIEWHSDWCKYENNVSYKIKLTPVGNWGAWCPNRSWYTHDMESSINNMYNLFEEVPVFDTEDEATEFAINKNYELYPDGRSEMKKLFDKIFK